MEMPVGGYGIAGTVRCTCGNEARVVVCGVGAYVSCPICGSGTYMCNSKEDAIKMFQETYGLEDAGSTEVLAFARYRDLERAADRTAVKIKEGFMEMGYILKVARDTDILSGSGYGSHEEFAEKRYGLDKGTVSRYIRIVERFSVGGNSHVLQEGYRNIGFAKLSLMLHMPDAIAEEITENYSKQEVQAIKEEVDAEHAVSDIEVAIEDAGVPEKEKAGTMLERAVRQLGKEQQALYHRLYDIYTVDGTAAMVMEVMAPQGDAVYMVRIPGTGRLMLSFSVDAVSVTNVRSGDKERYAAKDVLAAVIGIMHDGSVRDSWQQEYGEPMDPEATDTSRQDADNENRKTEPAKQKEKRKESKVVKAAPPKTPAKKDADMAHEPAGAMEEEQLPGQMEIVDYPEAIPDAHYEEITEAPPAENTMEAADMPEKPEDDRNAANTCASESTEGQEEKPEEVPERKEALEKDPELEGELMWMEFESKLSYLKQWGAVWNYEDVPSDCLVRAYHTAIDMAASIERIMAAKGVGTG